MISGLRRAISFGRSFPLPIRGGMALSTWTCKRKTFDVTGLDLGATGDALIASAVAISAKVKAVRGHIGLEWKRFRVFAACTSQLAFQTVPRAFS